MTTPHPDTADTGHPDESKLADLLRTWTDDGPLRRDLLAYLRHCPQSTPPEAILDHPLVKAFLGVAATKGLYQRAMVFVLQTVVGFWQSEFLRNPKRGPAKDEFMRAVAAVEKLMAVVTE